MSRTGFVLLAVLFGFVTPAFADPAFDAHVLPLLQKHCLKCHNETKKRGDLDLSTLNAVQAGGASGPALTPGKSKESLIVSLVGPKGDPHMPPTGQLASAEIDALAKWIDGLAAAPPTKGKRISQADRDHWAFRKLATPAVPKTSHLARTPIDAFIFATLEAKGLSPSDPASKRDLIRRATFDLIGLPPTPEEIEAFVSDPSPDAYERLVDRLLDSPRYGERWGQHWLDLARYAESNGIGEDKDRPHAWHYRDYVINAFNADIPYGDFIREQLAGDEYRPDDPACAAATGFCRHAPTVDVIRAADAEKYRIEELDDIVSTTSQVFMGLTMGCAKCHDHKYDPVTQRDYYRLMAVFNSTAKRDLVVADGLPRWDLAEKPDNARTTPNGTKILQPKEPTRESLMAMTDIGPKPRPTVLFWRGDFRNPGPEVSPGVPEVLDALPITFAPTQKTTGRRKAFAEWLATPENGLAYRVMANRLWQYHFGRGIVESSNNFGTNGDPPSHPELLEFLANELVRNGGRMKPIHRAIMRSSVYRQSSVTREREAKVDPENRLLWRAPKRRLEAEPLRDAILSVAGNLNGVMAGPSIRPRIHPALLANNQMTKWPTVGKEGPEHWRRSVYVFVKRSLRLPLLELYDAPSPNASCERRTESTVATQALLMMNNEFVQEQSGYFARRVAAEVGENERTNRAFLLAFGRSPDAVEREQVEAFLRSMREMHAARGDRDAGLAALTDLCHVLINSNEFVYLN